MRQTRNGSNCHGSTLTPSWPWMDSTVTCSCVTPIRLEASTVHWVSSLHLSHCTSCTSERSDGKKLQTAWLTSAHLFKQNDRGLLLVRHHIPVQTFSEVFGFSRSLWKRVETAPPWADAHIPAESHVERANLLNSLSVSTPRRFWRRKWAVGLCVRDFLRVERSHGRLCLYNPAAPGAVAKDQSAITRGVAVTCFLPQESSQMEPDALQTNKFFHVHRICTADLRFRLPIHTYTHTNTHIRTHTELSSNPRHSRQAGLKQCLRS